MARIFKPEWRKTVTALCQGCQQSFAAVASEVKRGNGKFCSQQCQRAFQAKANAEKMKTVEGWKERRRITRAMAERSEKIRAREAVSRAIRTGKLVRLECQICGARKTEAHHTDYANPLAVQWLCRKHHYLEHCSLERGGFVAL